MKTVYILNSLIHPGEWYVGITEDLDGRLRSHNAGQSAHTSKFVPWRVVVSITFENVERAEQFERYLKSGSGRAFASKHFR